MNPDVFFENFELLADAPNDEQASVFDEGTSGKNEQFAIEGRTKKSQKISKEEIPYELPDNA